MVEVRNLELRNAAVYSGLGFELRISPFELSHVPFQYTRATDADAAIRAVAGNPAATFLAGGTGLVDLMKLNVETPAAVVDVNRLLSDTDRAAARRRRSASGPTSATPTWPTTTPCGGSTRR